MKNVIEFATVASFCREKGYGFADVDGGGKIYFAMGRCRKIRQGFRGPVLVEENESCRRWPCAGEQIVFIRSAFVPKSGQSPSVYIWGYRKYWDDYQVYFRIVHGGNPVVSGTFAEICEHRPVDGDIVERFEGRDTEDREIWKMVNDPRFRNGHGERHSDCRWQKFETSPLLNETEWVPGQAIGDAGTQDAELEALASSTGGRRRGTTTKRSWDGDSRRLEAAGIHEIDER